MPIYHPPLWLFVGTALAWVGLAIWIGPVVLIALALGVGVSVALERVGVAPALAVAIGIVAGVLGGVGSARAELASPPPGWVALCDRLGWRHELCEPVGDDGGVVSEAVVAATHAALREDWWPVRELRGEDEWRLGVERGDCEDVALAAWTRMRATGAQPDALRLAWVEWRETGGHVVALARTEAGWIALDPLHRRAPEAWPVERFEVRAVCKSVKECER